jgi:hypothetical protein
MTMHCIKCGSALPPETATCPACGASTPYNVTASTPASDETPPAGSTAATLPSTSTQQEEPGLSPQEASSSSNWQEYQSPWEEDAPLSEVPQSADTIHDEGRPQGVTLQPVLVSDAQPVSDSSGGSGMDVGMGSLPAPEGKLASIQPQRSPLARSLLLIVLALIVIIASGVLYTVFVARPAEFHAQATAIAQTILSPESPQDVYSTATSGKPSINDSLSNPAGSSWSATGAAGNGCTFSSGAYHLSMSGTNFVMQCFSNTRSLSDFAFQVQMTIAQGSAGGLTFRVDNTQSSFYNFTITPDGFYELDLVSGGRLIKILNYGPSLAINTGLNQHNLLTVIARGSTIYLYVNKQNLATVSDSTYRSGSIGLFALKGNTISGDVAFSNAQVWKL